MASRTVTVTLNAAVGGFISGMNSAAASAGRLTDKLAQGGQYRQAWDQVGNTFIGVGAAALAGVGMVVKTFADFDKAMSGVAATGQDARDNLDGLREVAIQVGADTAFSAREAAQGMEELLKAGVSAQDVMGGGLKGAMDLAAAGALDVGAAAEIAATAMTQFGLSGQDVPHIADLIAAGAGKAQGSVHDMGMALKQSGLVASQFGLSIEDTVGTLSAFASAGLIGSDAGTSFKAMLLSLANPSKESAKLMTELGIAAYDANGNFVGMANLAEQLQTRLGGLTQAQRDQALAQIFGNDAVRAANVLYNEGAAGIQEWVANVNDMGYAAETAATMQDNLAGDIEKLTGSLESMFLTAGEGGNDFLRGVVQGAESAVDAFAKIPAPVQQGMLAITAIGGAALLTVGGLMRMASAAADGIQAFRQLGLAAAASDPQVRAYGVQALAAAAGLAAVALAAASVRKELDESTASVDEYTNALMRLGEGGAESAAMLNDEVSKFGDTWAMAGKDIQSTDDLFRELAHTSNVVAQGFQAVGDALGIGSTLTFLQQEVDKLDQSLTQMKPEQAAAAFRVLSQEMMDNGYGMQEQLVLFDAYKNKILEQANALGVTLSPTEQYMAMMGEIPPRLQAAMDAAAATKGPLGDQAAGLDEVATAAQQAAGALMEYASANLALSGSQLGVNSAILDAQDALAKNGQTLDQNTRAGIANQQALDNIAAAALKLSESQVKAGESGQVIGESMQRNRDAFIRAAQAMGMNAAEANALADRYGLVADEIQGLVPAANTAGGAVGALSAQLGAVPADKKVAMSIDGAEAVHGHVTDIKGQLDGVPDEKPVVITMPNGDAVRTTAGEIRASLEAIPPTTPAGVTAPGADTSKSLIQDITWMIEDLPEYKSIQVVMPDGSSTYTTAQGLGRAIRDIPDDKDVTLTLSNGETVTATAGEVRASLEQIRDRNVAITADPSGAQAGAAQAQDAVNATHGKTNPVNVDPSGSRTGAAQAQASVDATTGKTNLVNVDPGGAIRGSASAQASIDATTGATRSITVTSNASSAAASARAAMAAVPDITRTITTVLRTIQGAAEGGLIHPIGGAGTPAHVGAQRFDGGGVVRGSSPHPKADNIPAWLTAREFVQPVATVDHYGVGVMEALRRRMIPREAFSPYGYATGGLVGRPQPLTSEVNQKTYNFHTYSPIQVTEAQAIRQHAAIAALGG